MLSKNNKKQYDLKHANGRQHFSLRKTTLGLASVLLSTTLYLGGNSGQLVHAAEDTNSTTVSSNSDATSTEETKTTSVDKSALQNAYDNALNVQKSDVKYTNETDSTKKSAYDNAITAAKTVLDSTSATNDDVTDAINNLNTAYSALTGVATESTTGTDRSANDTQTVSVTSLGKSSISANALSASLASTNETPTASSLPIKQGNTGLYASKQNISGTTEIIRHVNLVNQTGSAVTLTNKDSYIVWGIPTANPNTLKYTRTLGGITLAAGETKSDDTVLYSYAPSSYNLSNAYTWNTLDTSVDSSEDYVFVVNSTQSGNVKYDNVYIMSRPQLSQANQDYGVIIKKNNTLTSADKVISNSSSLNGSTYKWSDTSTNTVGTTNRTITVTYPYKNGTIPGNDSWSSRAVTVSIPVQVVVVDNYIVPNVKGSLDLDKGQVLSAEDIAAKAVSNYDQIKAEGGVFKLVNMSSVNTSEITSGTQVSLVVNYPGEEGPVNGVTLNIVDPELDAKKQAANEAIDKLTNLNDAQKATAKAAVEAATTVDAVIAAQTNATTTDTNMGNLSDDDNYKNAESIKQGTNYQNADQSLKDAYDQAVSEAKALLDKTTGTSTGAVSTDPATVEAAKKKVDDALAALNGDSKLSEAKQAANEAIDKLTNLNDAQKATAKAAVEAATTVDAVTAAQTNATTTDTNMGNLSNDDNYKNAESIKQGTNYQNADQSLKDEYDQAVSEAKALLDKTTGASTGDVSTDPAAVEAAKKKVDDALAALNGDSKLSEAKKAANEAIDKLDNLNDAQKETAKAAVNAATTVDAVTAAQTNATTTDTNMGNLSNDDNYKNAESIKQGSNYQNADQKLKDAYDQAVAEAAELLDKTTGTSTGNASTDPAAVEAAKKKVDDALAALNGDSNLAKVKEEAKKAIDQMGDLSDADKEAAKANVDKATEISNVNTAKSDAQDLNDAKKAAKEAIDQMGDLSDADKTAAKSNVDKATDITGVNTAKQDAQDLNDAKKAAKEAIDALSNLNKAQKQAAIEAVNNATTKDAIQPIVDTATALNGKMGDLKQAIEEAHAKKSTTAYTQASDTKAFDDALTAADTLNSDKGDNEDANAVQAKIDALNNANLDGDKQLQDAKNDVINKINALTNLNKAQKQAAIEAVNNATTVAEIQPIVDTVTALDDKMGDLKKAIEAANAKKSTTAYTQASDTKDFDTALDNANTLNSDNGDNEDAEAVQAKIDALTNAKLDGEDQLAQAKNDAIDKINALTNLNKAQKQAAIEAVNNATTVAEIQPIVDTATALDGKMGDLKSAIEAANAKKTTIAYTQASDTKDFDTALTNATTLDSDNGDNEDADAVQAKIDALTNAKLDGEDQLAQAKNDAIDKINALTNLNKAQKQAAIEAVNNATTVAEIQPIVDTATTLDGKMSDLKKAIEKANAKKTTTAYTQASDTAAFDTALDNANTLNSDNGDNEDADAVQAKIDALTNAKLDGEDQLSKAKNDAIDKINALTNLNKAQKQAAIAQVTAAETKDAINPIVETATTLDGKMSDLKKAIEAAIKALNGLPTDKAALQRIYDRVDEIKNSTLYIYEDVKTREFFDYAVKVAKEVLDDPMATQDQVETAKAQLEAAINKLKGVAPQVNDINKEALKTEVAKKDQVQSATVYTNASASAKKAYNDALANAEAVLADENATQADIDDALAKLISALENLDGQDSPEASNTKNNSAQKYNSKLRASVSTKNKLGTNADRLPQTGSHESIASEVGLGILALGLAALGLAKKRKED